MAVASVLLLTFSLAATAGQGAQPPIVAAPTATTASTATQPAGPLAGLPSAPGPHIAKVQALEDDSWLELGVPAADPNWGTALGRSYSPRMVYLPKLRAAFLAGQGMHGGMKKGGIYEDEVFAYDINAHRWICLYPGSDANNLTLKLDKNGFEVDDHGQHVPVAILGHGHHLFAYNSDLNKVVIIPLGNTWWPGALPRRNQWLDERAAGWLRNPEYPWFYDLNTGKWEHRFVEGAGPGPGSYFSVVEYLPSSKKTFYLYKYCKAWLYDYATNQWTAAKAPAKPLDRYDWNGCLDSKRERVMVGQGRRMLAYDGRADEWKECAAPPEGVVFGNSTCNTISYDVANDVVVLSVLANGDGIAKNNSAEGRLWFYHPDGDRWEDKSTALPKWSGVVNMFYDVELNAHFFHVAGDSYPRGAIFVYRYKKLGT